MIDIYETLELIEEKEYLEDEIYQRRKQYESEFYQECQSRRKRLLSPIIKKSVIGILCAEVLLTIFFFGYGFIKHLFISIILGIIIYVLTKLFDQKRHESLIDTVKEEFLQKRNDLENFSNDTYEEICEIEVLLETSEVPESLRNKSNILKMLSDLDKKNSNVEKAINHSLNERIEDLTSELEEYKALNKELQEQNEKLQKQLDAANRTIVTERKKVDDKQQKEIKKLKNEVKKYKSEKSFWQTQYWLK